MEKEIIRYKESDLPVMLHHLRMERSAHYRGMHSHVALEIVEVKSGELQCCVNQQVIRLGPGEIIFINSNTGHKLVSENAEIVYMQIDVDFFAGNTGGDGFSRLYAFLSRSKAKPYLVFSGDGEIREILHKINGSYHREDPAGRWYMKAYVYELIAFMYARAFLAPPAICAKQLEKIKGIVACVEANFRAPITLDEICAVVGYNKYGVCHTFKGVTGATVFDYVNFLRVHYAVEKLKQKENSILEIAIDSGFSSPTYFNRVFKGIIGCSPSVYRKFLTEWPGEGKHPL